MDVRLSGSAIETKESQNRNAQVPMEVTPSGTTAWPFASGAYRQHGPCARVLQAATQPSASRSKIVANIAGRGIGVRVWVRELVCQLL